MGHKHEHLTEQTETDYANNPQYKSTRESH